MMTTHKATISWEDIHYYAADYAIRVAHTPKDCACCDQEIQPGDRYVHIIWTFPWTMVADDVDDEGRPTGGPAGEWMVANVHRACLTHDV